MGDAELNFFDMLIVDINTTLAQSFCNLYKSMGAIRWGTQ